MFSRVDFASVGSNDLVQFLYAADRGNSRVADRFDALAPATLRALKMIADKAAQYGKPVTLCGELASRPLEALALAAIGYRKLSLSPASYGPVKAMLLELDLAAAAALVAPLLTEGGEIASLRQPLRAFAEKAGLPL